MPLVGGEYNFSGNKIFVNEINPMPFCLLQYYCLYTFEILKFYIFYDFCKIQYIHPKRKHSMYVLERKFLYRVEICFFFDISFTKLNNSVYYILYSDIHSKFSSICSSLLSSIEGILDMELRQTFFIIVLEISFTGYPFHVRAE